MTVPPQIASAETSGPRYFDPQADLAFPDGRVYRVPLFRICMHGSGNARELRGCYCEVEAMEVGQQDPIHFRIFFLPSAFSSGIVGESHYSVLLAARTWVRTYLELHRKPPSELDCDTPVQHWFR